MRLVFIFEQKRFCHLVHGDTQSDRKCQQSFSKYIPALLFTSSINCTQTTCMHGWHNLEHDTFT